MNSDIKKIFSDAILGNKIAMENLIKTFHPKIKYYSKKLNYEEAETDMIIFMIEFIKKTNINKIINREIGEVVNFILIVLNNGYKNLLKKQINNKIEETTIDTYTIPVYDEYKNIEKYDTFLLFKGLTGNQRKIIIAKYIYGYNCAEIARLTNKSRQAINKQELKALSIIKNNIRNFYK